VVRDLAEGFDGRNSTHDYLLTNKEARRFYDKYYRRRTSLTWGEFIVNFKLEAEYRYAVVLGDDVATWLRELCDTDGDGLINVKELNHLFEVWSAQRNEPLRAQSASPSLQQAKP
jgi:hypothetical protein